jgi:photosystem II stability/assembly factor-like uncharacterized protein
MRTALAIVMLTFTLGLVSRPLHGQTRAKETSALYEIQMINRETGWAMTDPRYVSVCGRESCLLRTTDGGTVWRDVTPLKSPGQKVRLWKFTALSALIAWVIPTREAGSSGQIFRTTDGGSTWRSATIPQPPGTGVGVEYGASLISFINPREGWLIVPTWASMGSEEDEIYHSTDGGDTWVNVASATRENHSSGFPMVGKSGMAFLNSTTGWVTALDFRSPDQSHLYVTHDGGRKWRAESLPLPPQLGPHWGIHPRSVKPFGPRDAILRVDYSLLNDSGEITGMVIVFYATIDSGATWTYTVPVRRVNDDYYPSSFADMNHGWLMDGFDLHATSDGGRQWMTIQTSQLPVDVSQLNFVSPQVGWAIRQRFPYLRKTLDGGRTWAPVPYTIVGQ